MYNTRPRATLLVAALLWISCQDTISPPATSPAKQATVKPAPAKVAAPRHQNRLAGQRSHYLRQHAANPVDWYPWGEEALARARTLKRPIFLSIGYASCHWCHVMEREVFEKEDVAAYLNANFISIKVDREERPDLDAVYMAAVQTMTGSGGWPLSVFLTPDLKPFYGGTYFPRDRFLKLLARLKQAFSSERAKVDAISGQLYRAISSEPQMSDQAAVDRATLDAVFGRVSGRFDQQWGGLQGRMKFPSPMTWLAILHHHRKTGSADAARMVRTTLQKMGDGGMQDHVGGGFHRYTTERTWLVPHFEKMLYDNALLAVLYLEASVVLKAPRLAAIGEDTLEFILRDLQGKQGGFFASLDADSGGVEGSYYVWTPAEITRVAGKTHGPALSMLLGVTAAGNFEGHSIITRRVSPLAVAARHKLELAAVDRLFTRWRPALLKFRDRRVKPGLDPKVITAWNGLALMAMARGQQVLGDARYGRAGARAADHLWKAHRDQGKLLRSSYDGVAQGAAVLDDYAVLALGLLELHQATGAPRHLRRALTLLRQARQRFRTPRACFYLTPAGQAAPMGRQVLAVDNARPSGNSAMLQALLRAAALTGDAALLSDARRCLGSQAKAVARMGLSMAWWVDAAQLLLGPYYVVIIAGDPGAVDTRALRQAYWGQLPAHALLISLPAGGPAAETLKLMPVTEGKTALGGKATAYVCKFGSCKYPTSSPAEFTKQLMAGWTR